MVWAVASWAISQMIYTHPPPHGRRGSSADQELCQEGKEEARERAGSGRATVEDELLRERGPCPHTHQHVSLPLIGHQARLLHTALHGVGSRVQVSDRADLEILLHQCGFGVSGIGRSAP